ncbi:MAG: 16S rRNA (adenine(1518)-N(6)/adenine(1519)-N(6))-dimethyltransferase, partial [Lachnospiraceae bacterium]|nr:16S rRNA (adenine(1518)-N(6)/adenine(1519)-N(6))-dimethyltransferase [Lachnospiraceae bacterium]
KEVADRMQVGPGTKDYGALSLAVQYDAKPEVIINVPPACFMPRPGVGSSVIRLTRFTQPPVKVASEKKFFSIIRAAFNQRRKTLVNALVNSPSLIGDDGNSRKATRSEVCEILDKMGLSQTIRGEALTLEEFAEFSNLF